ncbi:MAG: GAF domain-containing sensor histidine kinase [Anaerolineae bacterium]|nr:GAF domain-containing sensor histidine kinase [Anaerolineae bacterium]
MSIDRAIVPLILLIGYVAILALMALRHRIRNRTERTLALYLFVLALWDVAVAFAVGVLRDDWVVWFGERIALAGLVVLAVIFYNLMYAFLRKDVVRKVVLAWWVMGALYLVLFVLVVARILPFEIVQITVGQMRWTADSIIELLSILGWGVFAFAPIWAIWRSYRQTVSPMHRNRYRYLFLALLLLVLGDAFFASRRVPFNLFGLSARFSGVLVLTLLTFSHNLLDIRTVVRYTFGYIVSTLIAVGIGFGLMWGTWTILQGELVFSALIGAGVAAVFLSFATHPLRQGIQKLVDRGLFHVESADYDSVLRAYGEKVIETLRLDPLADLVMSTVMHATGIEYGGLYLVREGKQEIGGLLLDPIMILGALPKNDFELHPDSPLAGQLHSSDNPVSQYDVDLQERYVEVPKGERAWLRALGIELLLPVHTNDKLVGVVALGPKESGEMYTQDELAWLKALADQTAVALQNARLFDQVETMSVNVMRLNAELELANRALERTNEELTGAYSRLQELDKLKSDFIGVITHELRTPFVAAGFSVQLLARYAERGMLNELSQQIKQLDKELADGRQMIDRVISFASLLSKQGELKRERANLETLIRETVAPLETMAHSRNIEIEVHVAGDLPLMLVDKDRLGEAMYHMVHNAIKFNHEGGSVSVSCRTQDGSVRFEVQDTGCGIAPDQLPTIWEAFTQTADSVNRGVEGLGLGLPLIKFVTQAHGGTVWASSEVDRGSAFGFNLPIAVE